MKTVQMTIDDDLLAEVDRVTSGLKITRSAFVRQALLLALRKHEIAAMEQQQAEGYAAQPIVVEAADEWVAEQVWGPG